MSHYHQVFRFFRDCHQLVLIVLALFLWTSATALPLIHVDEQSTSKQNARILPSDPVPSVLPSNLSKPQQRSDGTIICVQRTILQEEHRDISIRIIKYPNDLKRTIIYCLVYTQTVTTFLWIPSIRVSTWITLTSETNKWKWIGLFGIHKLLTGDQSWKINNKNSLENILD